MRGTKNQIYAPDYRRTAEPKAEEREPMTVIAVDPGGAHVGVAVWNKNGDIYAKEHDADDWLPLFALVCPHIDQVIIESFVLYPGKAKSLSWSPMQTAEMIGAMKWIAWTNGTLVSMQGADVKIPTRRQCKARGIQWRNRSGHASDALLHLHYWLLRNEVW